MKHNKHKKLKITLITVSSIIFAFLLTFFIYVSIYSHASGDVDALLEDPKEASISENGSYYSLKPDQKTLNSSLIFYPGAKVEAKAYIPLCYSLCLQGLDVYLTKMPFNLAFFKKDAAKQVIADNSEEDNWYLCGHSLGGAMAAEFISQDESDFKGLVLLGAYSMQDISKTSLKTATIYGSQDGVINRSKYQSCYANLPMNNKETIIEGGCHAYFGNYGSQRRDGTPTITRAEQQALTVSSIVSLIKE